jgi:tetratricopeptide (TPR) repeat protein
LDKSDEALKCFDKALEINPQLAKAWYNRGIALDLLGKPDEAIKSFNKAKELLPYVELPDNKLYPKIVLGTHPALSFCPLKKPIHRLAILWGQTILIT